MNRKTDWDQALEEVIKKNKEFLIALGKSKKSAKEQSSLRSQRHS